MKKFSIHSTSFALFFLALATMAPDMAAMKRSHAQTIEPLAYELPSELLWPILSLCPNSTVMQICKHWHSMLSFSNWKNIASNQPQMLTRHPRHCEQVYYRLIKEKDLATLSTLLAADKQSKQHLWSLLENRALRFIINDAAPEVLALIKPHINIGDLTYIKNKHLLKPRDERNHSNRFTDIILYSDIEGMKKYLQEYDRALQLDAVDENTDSIARYASIAILTVLKSILQEGIKMDEIRKRIKILAWYNRKPVVAANAIMAKAAMKKNGYRIDIVEYLLSNGATTDYDQSHADESCIVGALTCAHEKNDYRLLELFVRHGLDVNPAENDDRLIRYNETEGVNLPSLATIIDCNKWVLLPALMWAIVKGDIRLVNTLLILGADPEILASSLGDDGIYTDTLTLAQELGNQEIIQALRFAKIKTAKASQTA